MVIALLLLDAAHGETFELFVDLPLATTDAVDWRPHGGFARGRGEPRSLGGAVRAGLEGALVVEGALRHRWQRWAQTVPPLSARVTSVSLLAGLRHASEVHHLVGELGLDVERYGDTLFPGATTFAPAVALELGGSAGPLRFGLRGHAALPTTEHTARVTDPANTMSVSWTNGGAWTGLRVGLGW